MAFAHGEICKTIAMAAQLSAPYLTEGATKIEQSELVGKRVGESYKFSFDKADIAISKNGMATSGWANSGAVQSQTEEIKIWDASAKVANGALDKKLAAGNWEEFAKQTGVETVNAMAEAVAVADMGKAGDVVLCSSVKDMTAKLLQMNQFGASVRGYGSWNGVGAMLATEKQNAPVIADDKYVNGQAWSWGNLVTLRGMKLPSMVLAGASAGVKKLSITTAKAVTVGSGSIVAGEAVKLDGKNIVVYFPTTQATDAIVLGKVDSTITNNTIDSSTDTYEPIIVRADGAQGCVEASGLVEAADANDSFEGVGVSHTQIPNAGRGLDHYYDVVGAYGVARKEAVRVYLLKA